MLGTERRAPRAPGDRRMYLYFNYSESGSLRWYVKVSRKGRRIGISEEYGTSAFDAAYEAGVAGSHAHASCQRHGEAGPT